MRHVVNSRSDLENLRGTADFEDVLRSLHGAFVTWSLVDGAWVAQENLAAIERFGYDKAGFLAEIAPFDFPAPVPPDLPVEPEPVDPLTLPLTKRQIVGALIEGGDLFDRPELYDAEALVDTAIEQIADDKARALARNDWRNVLSNYLRDHPLFNDPDLMAAMSLTSNQIDALWTLGTQQPA